MAGGSPPSLTHGLAAVYLGFTVAFGHSMIRWADARFAHRFAGGPPPRKPPQYGAAKVAYEWREWGKMALAWGIAVAVMLLTAAVAGTGVPSPLAWSADPMWSWGARLVPVLLGSSAGRCGRRSHRRARPSTAGRRRAMPVAESAPARPWRQPASTVPR